MMDARVESGIQLFINGYNCAQSVLLSFAEDLETDKNTAMCVAAGFGGGMGQMQQTCGAMTGAYMVIGLLAAREKNDIAEIKKLSNDMVVDFTGRFRAKFGHTNCMALLGVDINSEEGGRLYHERNLKKLICLGCVKSSIEILESFKNGWDTGL